MSWFKSCPCCGANLDPGEICNCKKEAAPELEPPRAAQANNLIVNISNTGGNVK